MKNPLTSILLFRAHVSDCRARSIFRFFRTSFWNFSETVSIAIAM